MMRVRSYINGLSQAIEHCILVELDAHWWFMNELRFITLRLKHAAANVHLPN